MKKILYIIAALPLLSQCSGRMAQVSTTQDFTRWLNDEKNGCKVTREVNGMVIEVKYLPPAFLALKDFESRTSPDVTYDSLYKAYQHSTAFLLNFRPKDEEHGQDIMFRKVSSYKEYVERSMTLNFDLESKVSLKTEKGSYTPVLSTLENTYGLSKGRNVFMVFTAKADKAELSEARSYDLVYTDDIYDLGILHFTFDHGTISKNEPVLTIQPSS